MRALSTAKYHWDLCPVGTLPSSSDQSHDHVQCSLKSANKHPAVSTPSAEGNILPSRGSYINASETNSAQTLILYIIMLLITALLGIRSLGFPAAKSL